MHDRAWTWTLFCMWAIKCLFIYSSSSSSPVVWTQHQVTSKKNCFRSLCKNVVCRHCSMTELTLYSQFVCRISEPSAVWRNLAASSKQCRFTWNSSSRFVASYSQAIFTVLQKHSPDQTWPSWQRFFSFRCNRQVSIM